MFLTKLKVEAVRGGRWKLLAPLDYQINAGVLFATSIIRVPRFFVTDLASIPKALRWLISQNEQHRRAAVLHDYLYYRQGHVGLELLSRKECDQLFLEAMHKEGVPYWKRQTMYFGVRIGGWLAWEK